MACLHRVLRCAVRLIGRIPEYASVSAYMSDMLIGSQLLSASLIGWLFWSGSAFLIVPLLTSASSVDRYLIYLDGEPFVPLLLASYWYLVLKLQLGSVVLSPLRVPPPGIRGVQYVYCMMDKMHHGQNRGE